MSELGVTGLEHYAGQTKEHWIPALNTNSKRIKVYDQIYRFDPTASTMIKTTSMFMSGSTPRVKPASDSAADRAAAQFIEECMFDMTKSWLEVMSDIVLFLPYGFFDMEIVYWRRDGTKSKYDDNRIGWRKWAPRHPSTLHKWEMDENGGISAMVQRAPPNYDTTTLPIEKLLHFTTSGMGKNNPEGVSILDGAYSSWFFAKNLEIEEGIIAERMSGTPVITLPENADLDETDPNSDLSRAQRLVRNIKIAEDMGLTLPFGYEFRYTTPQHGTIMNLGDVIMRHRRNIARSLVMDFIMLGGGDQGSFAMHKDKSQLYIRSLNAYMDKIADVINRHGIPRLLDMNVFPGISGYPEMYFTPITKIDIGDFAQVISGLFNSGALSYDLETENQVRREIGLEEIEEPGVSFKQFAPLSASGYNEPEASDMPEETEEEEEEETTDDDFEFSDLPHGAAVEYTDDLQASLMDMYTEWGEEVAEDLVESDDDEFDEVLAAALLLLARKMVSELTEAMMNMWRKTTGRSPSVQGLRAILDELQYQEEFVRGRLIPDLENDIGGKAQELKDKGAKRDVIITAIIGAVAAHRYRVGMYAGSVFKVWGNYARPLTAFEAMEGRGEVEFDWSTGKIVGEGVLARYFGPSDERNCQGCAYWVERGWTDPAIIPLIGSLECNGNCRHEIQYKYRGRIY
jgi:hypothetical protein